MHTSLFDLFKIGIGPSSSHTVGPMRAAGQFIRHLSQAGLLGSVRRIRVELYGSLALTGHGHGTDRGILLGLMGKQPDKVDPSEIEPWMNEIRASKEISLGGVHKVLVAENDLFSHKDKVLPGHSNGMRFTVFDEHAGIIESRIYYSIGGGFVREEGQTDAHPDQPSKRVPYPFRSAEELLQIGASANLPIHQIILENELCWRPETEIRSGILNIWDAMASCIHRGLNTQGELPGGLHVQRRAAKLALDLGSRKQDDLGSMDWLNLWAMAVNEENAAGGKVVTAPTNGAAGVIPSVAQYYLRMLNGTEEGLQRFFLAATAVGVLYKENASISGAEVGCQGEVGVACSMAAAGLVSALEGTNGQIEHAAEIAMEHNLGMTCDPVGGLVQIPCIERNAFGAVKAVNAARMAMQNTTGHLVSLDQVIRTMYQTGMDMQTRYKETSLGGLALNVIEC
jgi:L-serine dehydratase